MSNVEAPNVNSGETNNPDLLAEQSGMPNMSSTKPFTVDTNMQVNGDLDVTGTVTATSFVGDGSQLTGISGGTGGGLDSADVTLLVDSDYVQARETPQDFAYSSLTGTPTALSSFTNDTSYITAADILTTVDSDYVQARVTLDGVGLDSAAVTLLVDSDYVQARQIAEIKLQSPATSPEYYIYVGSSGNKLSQIQDTRGSVSNLVYDQEFATLQEAFNFMMENSLEDAGYSDYSGGYKNASYVVALEQGVTHSADSGGYLRLGHVNANVKILSQNSVDPAGANGSVTSIGTSSDYLVIYGIPQLQMGGDINVPAYSQIGYSNVKWFYNQYNDDINWNGGLRVYDGSTFYTDGVINSGILVQDNSYANVGTLNATSNTRVGNNSALEASNITTSSSFSVYKGGRVDCNSLTATSSTLSFEDGSTVSIRGNLALNGTASLLLQKASKLIYQSVSGTSTSTHTVGLGGGTLTTAEVVSKLNGNVYFGMDGSTAHDVNNLSDIGFEFNGDITATSFVGDGSGLTNLPSGGGLDSAGVQSLIDAEVDATTLILGEGTTAGIRVGSGATANTLSGGGIAIGQGADATGTQGIAIGINAGSSGSGANAIAIGITAETANSANAIGRSATARSQGNAFGFGTFAAGSATAIGHNAKAGDPTFGTGSFALAVGINSSATQDHGMHISSATNLGNGPNSVGGIVIESTQGRLEYNSTNDWTFNAGVTMTDLTASGATVVFSNLPTTDPVNAGQLWNDNGTLKVSAG